ncbi:MAG TPA: filamentous hemagglutinin N-terminal domain-containing protein, partial [bacterium]|nr:filamentous hemagglutinin N-terminal domain-containing protein [bacterium]
TVTLDRAQNGVQVINIAAPNSRGLSHNRFVEFNVTRDGVILNNSGRNAVSVLGGALYTNPNMAGKTEASLILSEVTGVNRSNINGFTEVHGRKADYVLANPNGITCSGCGFINVNRATLTTGRPEIENGFLKNLDVQKGDVTIGSAGVNAENLSYFEIISRTAKLQGQINADDLSIVTGRNDYDYQTKQVTVKTDDGEPKPELSIDATNLGSVYAGRIKMISTEAGVGVNVPNNMYANAADMIIDSKGNIVFKNITANTGLSLKADGKIKGLGSARTNGNIELDSDQLELVFGSGLFSHNNININSNDIINAGSITSAYDLNMTGFSLLNSGELMSDGLGDLAFTDLSNTGTILTTGVLNADGVNFNNSGDVLSYSDINLNFSQALNSGQVLSSNDLTFGGLSINNSGEILGNHNVTVGFNDVINSGDILATNILALSGQNIINNINGELLSYNDLDL